MAALLAQHRKLWRRRSSKGVSLAMVGLGCGAQVCEALAQLIARLHVRPRWHGWEWSDPALTPLVVQLLQAALVRMDQPPASKFWTKSEYSWRYCDSKAGCCSNSEP